MEGIVSRGTEKREEHTWPPENPTATTPSSAGFARNLGLTIDVVVILADFWVLSCNADVVFC